MPEGQLKVILEVPTLAATGHESGTEGIELGATSHTRVVTLDTARLQSTSPHILRTWVADGRVGPDGTVRLRMPSALFADTLADALVAEGARYALLPHMQFTHLTVARMLRDERRLVQCERFIARGLHAGTVFFALQHAVRYARPQLLRACYHWLRRTGGVTSSLLLRRPDLALRVNVSRGLLLQGDAEGFDLAALAPLVARERQRKRVYYAAPEAAAVAQATESLPLSQSTTALVVVPLASELQQPVAPASEAGTDGGDGSFVDVSLADVHTGSDLAVAAFAALPAAAAPTSAADPALAAAQLAFLERSTVRVEVGVVRPLLPSEEQTPEAPTQAPSTTLGASPPPPPIPASPAGGYPGLARCFVVRRRDGHGPCRCLPQGSEAAEWAAIVQQRLGADGDEDAVPGALSAAAAAAAAAGPGGSAVPPPPVLTTKDLLPWLGVRAGPGPGGCVAHPPPSTGLPTLLQGDCATPDRPSTIALRATGAFDDDEGRCPTHDGLRAPPLKQKPGAAPPAPVAAADAAAAPGPAGDSPARRLAGACSCSSRLVSPAGRHVYELRREADGALICAAAATSTGGGFVFARTAHLLHLSPRDGCVGGRGWAGRRVPSGSASPPPPLQRPGPLPGLHARQRLGDAGHALRLGARRRPPRAGLCGGGGGRRGGAGRRRGACGAPPRPPTRGAARPRPPRAGARALRHQRHGVGACAGGSPLKPVPQARHAPPPHSSERPLTA